MKLSTRANITDKMKFSTNASQLVAKVGQINMVELAKYGPGKCLGEGIYVIP